MWLLVSLPMWAAAAALLSIGIISGVCCISFVNDENGQDAKFTGMLCPATLALSTLCGVAALKIMGG